MTTDKIILEPKAYLLKNKIQNYEWGTAGADAIIPELLGFSPEEGKPYAELWIGAHSKASSTVEIAGKEISLDELIETNAEEILGPEISKQFGKKLPFLLKVLSASHALSIQAHPDKKKAVILHAKDPKNYPDDNHKPEIAIALDSLDALVGFKPVKVLLEVIEKYKGIKEFIGIDAFNQAKLKYEAHGNGAGESEIIKEIYELIMSKSVSEPEQLKYSIKILKKDILGKDESSWIEEERLFLGLEKEYGSDVGLFSIFLFNLVKLKEGEGIFLNSGVPHAYLKGNIIECMANSDNVVRVGLTPKFKDTDSLLEILSYDTAPVKLLNTEAKPGEVTYNTPVKEFEITRWQYAKGTELNFVNDTICIILVITGSVSITSAQRTVTFKKGDAILIPALLKEYSISFSDDSLAFRAGIPHSQYFRLP